MLILGIETSCDETSAAVVKDGKEIVSNVILSQNTLHYEFGGVVPEIACRAHLEFIIDVIDNALRDAKIQLKEIDAIAVVTTPGLIGALLIGVTAAKSLSMILDVPLMAIDHLHAHIYANNLEHNDIPYPAISLVVSGGHTILFFLKVRQNTFPWVGLLMMLLVRHLTKYQKSLVLATRVDLLSTSLPEMGIRMP